MPIHCLTCVCTKVSEGRQYGPDPKTIILYSKGTEHLIGIKHPLYRLRYAILSRCYNAKPSEYATYQGKGITVCDEWKTDPISFYQWCLDNGWKKGLCIDRIDPMGNYEPSNCQFLTLSENSRKGIYQNNVHRNAKLTASQVASIRESLEMGYTYSFLAEEYGVSRSTIKSIKCGQNWKGK